MCAGMRWPAETGCCGIIRSCMKGVVEPERWKELKRGGAPGELDEARCRKSLLGGSGGDQPGQRRKRRQRGRKRRRKQPESKKSPGLQEFLEKGDQNPADCGGNRSHPLFGGLWCWALLWFYRKLRVACAETVKERLAAGREHGVRIGNGKQVLNDRTLHMIEQNGFGHGGNRGT